MDIGVVVLPSGGYIELLLIDCTHLTLVTTKLLLWGEDDMVAYACANIPISILATVVAYELRTIGTHLCHNLATAKIDHKKGQQQ
jgi:hypothetical protein